MSLRKPKKEDIKATVGNVGKETKSCVSKCLGDISKTSATKQIVLGVSSGCITGLLACRIGKVIAFAVGGGIVILQIANHRGYIRVNWSKVNREVDKVVDKVEEQLSGEGPSWMNKVERYVDRKVDQTEDLIKNKQVKAKRWYSSFTGGSNCRLDEIHVFLVSFAAGVAIGMVAS